MSEVAVSPETAKPSPLRRRGIEVGLGALFGIVIACLNGPGFLSLFYTPLRGGALCGSEVNDALAYFVKLQLVSGLVGGAFILVASFFVRRMLRKRRDARAVPTA